MRSGPVAVSTTQADLLLIADVGGFRASLVPHEIGGASVGAAAVAAVADFDGDGDVDVAVSSEVPPTFRLLRNDRADSSPRSAGPSPPWR